MMLPKGLLSHPWSDTILQSGYWLTNTGHLFFILQHYSSKVSFLLFQGLRVPTLVPFSASLLRWHNIVHPPCACSLVEHGDRIFLLDIIPECCNSSIKLHNVYLALLISPLSQWVPYDVHTPGMLHVYKATVLGDGSTHRDRESVLAFYRIRVFSYFLSRSVRMVSVALYDFAVSVVFICSRGIPAKMFTTGFEIVRYPLLHFRPVFLWIHSIFTRL